jgi:hypothetical protein
VKNIVVKTNAIYGWSCPQLIKLDHKDITIMFSKTNVNNNVEEGEE